MKKFLYILSLSAVAALLISGGSEKVRKDLKALRKSLADIDNLK